MGELHWSNMIFRRQLITAAAAIITLAVLLASSDAAHIEDTVVPESGLGFTEVTEEIDHSSSAPGKQVAPGSDESMAQLLQGGKRGKADLMEEEPAASSPEEPKMIVPESEPNLSLVSIKTGDIHLQSETLKLKLCDQASECVYELTLSSTSSESDNGATASQDEITLSYKLRIRPAGAANTFVIDGEDYVVGGQSPGDPAQVGLFNNCFNNAERHVVQDSNGNVQMLAKTEDSQSGVTEACSAFEEKIQSIYAGTIEALASVFASADDGELMQFSERVPDANGFRTSHYRREKHDDGSMTVHRARTWEHAADRHPMPILLQNDGATSSLTMTATGSSTSNSNGVTTKSTDVADAKLGEDSKSTGFSCQGNGKQDGTGTSCNTNEVPGNNEGEKIRLKSHEKAGRKPVPILQAITTSEVISDPSDEEMNTGYIKFMQGLVEIGNSQPGSFEPGKLRDSVHAQMRSPKIRAQTVNDLSKNKIKSPRAVQTLMHAIGSAATYQKEAVDQLIELASTSDIDQTAASQALVALLQAKCYNHDHAIRGLAKLARPDAQTFTQIMAVHVQHGLMAHAEHCANNKYTEASSHKYDDILAGTHRHLEEAVANGDDGAALILLDAIGNTQSQRPKETAALVAVANNGHLHIQTQMLAVRNLGKLYTPQALVALKELAADPINKGSALQKACEQAISGEMLAKGDTRKPLQSEAAVLVQQQKEPWHKGASIGMGYAKVWPLPADGDIRAEAKIGIELNREVDYADTTKDPFCLHGYAGVDGKAWTWTISLVQAGAKKCFGFKFYAYLSILQVTIWNKEQGSGITNGIHGVKAGDAIQQFSQAGDANGHCGTNVDAMDLSATISYDKDFFSFGKTIQVGIFFLNGRVKITGELGLKAGWGNMGDPNCSGDHEDEPRCKSGGEIVFAIPYVQATLTGELSLDLAIAKGGAGVNVIIVKFSLPSTQENMVDMSCAGIYFKVEGLGGKVYAFVDVISGINVCGWFCLEREWSREWELTIYEWSSPLVWQTNDVTCTDTSGATTKDTSLTFPPAATSTCDETLRGSGDAGYRGCQSVTKSGRKCQGWWKQSPHEHSANTPENNPNDDLASNYCRNPDGEDTIWCYTMDDGKRWEECNPL